MPIFGLEPTTSAVAPDLLLTRSGRASAQIILFVLEVIAKTAKELAEKRAREKWAGHTTDPPTTKWPADKSYACFLSHYKTQFGLGSTMGCRYTSCHVPI